jgi:putative transposase
MGVRARNMLACQFKTPAPNISWVADITYIRTQEGWLYLAVVLDLFSRQIIGWAMKLRMTANLAVDALLMAVWRRKPKQPVLVHSDQGSQFTGGEWQDFLKAHNLSCSMSRRGNCHDNAVAESFFQLLKRERIKRRIYPTRDEAAATYLIISRCFTTQSGAMVPMMGCRRWSLKSSSIFNNRVSRKPGAIQLD